MPKLKNTEEGAATYQQVLFSHMPMYTTRLVRETHFTFPHREQVSSPEDVAAVLQHYFEDKDREEFLVVLLDQGHTMIGLSQICVGGLAASIVEPRQVFKTAILANAAAIIVAHQHPSGNVEPSREDLRITRQLVEAGTLMGVPVHDHIIVAEDRYVSLAERGLLGS